MNKRQQTQMEQEVSAKIFNSAFISVFITNMLLQLGQQMMNTLVAKYTDILGAKASTIGLVVGSFALSSLVFKIIAAPAIDTYNKKYILMGAMLIMAIAYGGYSFSNSVESVWVFRIIQGIGQAFTITCCLALASETLPAKKMGTGIAYFSLAQAMCQAIGPQVGLFMSRKFGYKATFAIGAAVMAIGAVSALRIKVHFIRIKKFKISLKSVIAKEALVPAAIMGLLILTYSNINSFLVIYAGTKGCDTNIGLFFTAYAVTLLLTRPTIGKLSDQFGLVAVFIPALCCFALAFWLISISSTLPMFLVAGCVSAFGYGACQPTVQTLCMKCVSKDRRGAASSTNYIGSDIGQMFGPIMAGKFADLFGYITMWRIMILPVFLAMIVIIVNRKYINSVGETQLP